MDTEALTGFAMPARASAFISVLVVLSTDICRTPMTLRASRSLHGLRCPWYRHTNERRSPSGLRPKRPVGPFRAKPAQASALIGVSILMDTEALAGFAMPARASAFNSV